MLIEEEILGGDAPNYADDYPTARIDIPVAITAHVNLLDTYIVEEMARRCI